MGHLLTSKVCAYDVDGRPARDRQAGSHPEKAGCPWRFLPEAFGPRQTVRSWHDRLQADDIRPKVAAVLTRAARARRERDSEPSTAIMSSQNAASRLQTGMWDVDGSIEMMGIRRRVPTGSLGLVLATIVTAPGAGGAAGPVLDRAASHAHEPVKVDGIHVGDRMELVDEPSGVEVQVTTGKGVAKGFEPSPPT